MPPWQGVGLAVGTTWAGGAQGVQAAGTALGCCWKAPGGAGLVLGPSWRLAGAGMGTHQLRVKLQDIRR